MKTITTSEDHKDALRRVENLWNSKENSADSEELNLLVTLISDYEEKNYPIEKPNPLDALKFRADQENA